MATFKLAATRAFDACTDTECDTVEVRWVRKKEKGYSSHSTSTKQAQSKPLRLYLCLFRKLELVGGGPLGAHLHMVLQTCHAKGVGVRKRAANDRGPSIANSGILRRQNTNLYALETRCHRHRVDFSKKGTRKAAVCAASEDGLKLWNASQLLNLRLEYPVWCKISKVYETRMAKYRSSLAQTSIPWCRRWCFYR